MSRADEGFDRKKSKTAPKRPTRPSLPLAATISLVACRRSHRHPPSASPAAQLVVRDGPSFVSDGGVSGRGLLRGGLVTDRSASPFWRTAVLTPKITRFLCVIRFARNLGFRRLHFPAGVSCNVIGLVGSFAVALLGSAMALRWPLSKGAHLFVRFGGRK